MATNQQNFRMDVPSAGISAVWAAIAAIVFFLIMGILDVRGAADLAFVFAIIAGWLYTTNIFKKITPSYLEAAGGGAVAGAIYAALVTVGGLLLSQVLGDTTGSLGDALFDLADAYALSDIANQVITSALLGALGGAGLVLVRTQQIK
ncbi:MAG: hypothetical protein KIS80_05595 [Anaerolineales bacterium]|nr:hypothetical protein [Anaerolineales bacterium]